MTRVHIPDDGLPSNPTDFLAQLTRAQSYENAWTRAGHRNWALAVEQARMELAASGGTYEAKLAYRAKLLEAREALAKQLSDIEKARGDRRADLAKSEFTEENDRRQFNVGEVNESRKTGATETGLMNRAKLNAETSIERQRMYGAIYGSRGSSPLKLSERNEEIINQDAIPAFKGDPNTSFEVLWRNIGEDRFSDKTSVEGDNSAFQMFDKLVNQESAAKGVPVEEVMRDMLKRLSPYNRARVEAGAKLEAEMRGGVGVGGADGRVPQAGPPGAYTAAQADRVGLARTGVEDAYNAAADPLRQRIGVLDSQLGALGLPDQERGDLIGRAREIYRKHFPTYNDLGKGKGPRKPEALVQRNQQMRMRAAVTAGERIADFVARADDRKAAGRWEKFSTSDPYVTVQRLLSNPSVAEGKTTLQDVANKIRDAYKDKQDDYEKAIAAYITLQHLKDE